uniref:Uncharacterized protein n=1 Tax=Chromera velia CCMP2878 TaxID=1169474 RepID=A0A0G4IEM0_9ALVE|eukprot:Cvel_13665.t1-p1 / transcript=Cvel_13665.t1 / gene=Cvel_13665 / organism=Chromera_velia_CCMP2878 / gene_product=hypothetical protein / transcript_product=hypothetical protein / location=Cvel_scaffold943:34895-37842(-) / protein_length=859 / sequence_SO=supercontig / SO=protein_coding / is_pseudo=false
MESETRPVQACDDFAFENYRQNALPGRTWAVEDPPSEHQWHQESTRSIDADVTCLPLTFHSVFHGHSQESVRVSTRFDASQLSQSGRIFSSEGERGGETCSAQRAAIQLEEEESEVEEVPVFAPPAAQPPATGEAQRGLHLSLPTRSSSAKSGAAEEGNKEESPASLPSAPPEGESVQDGKKGEPPEAVNAEEESSLGAVKEGGDGGGREKKEDGGGGPEQQTEFLHTDKDRKREEGENGGAGGDVQNQETDGLAGQKTAEKGGIPQPDAARKSNPLDTWMHEDEGATQKEIRKETEKVNDAVRAPIETEEDKRKPEEESAMSPHQNEKPSPGSPEGVAKWTPGETDQSSASPNVNANTSKPPAEVRIHISPFAEMTELPSPSEAFETFRSPKSNAPPSIAFEDLNTIPLFEPLTIDTLIALTDKDKGTSSATAPRQKKARGPSKARTQEDYTGTLVGLTLLSISGRPQKPLRAQSFLLPLQAPRSHSPPRRDASPLLVGKETSDETAAPVPETAATVFDTWLRAFAVFDPCDPSQTRDEAALQAGEVEGKGEAAERRAQTRRRLLSARDSPSRYVGIVRLPTDEHPPVEFTADQKGDGGVRPPPSPCRMAEACIRRSQQKQEERGGEVNTEGDGQGQREEKEREEGGRDTSLSAGPGSGEAEIRIRQEDLEGEGGLKRMLLKKGLSAFFRHRFHEAAVHLAAFRLRFGCVSPSGTSTILDGAGGNGKERVPLQTHAEMLALDFHWRRALARSLFFDEKPKAALCLCTETIGLHPGCARLHRDRGEILKSLGRHTEAGLDLDFSFDLETGVLAGAAMKEEDGGGVGQLGGCMRVDSSHFYCTCASMSPAAVARLVQNLA